jgi:hypothetical protein|tara:strand:- start:231 stop:359 length:129 start_codon:yes stop_codon:yes gene_type:complete
MRFRNGMKQLRKIPLNVIRNQIQVWEVLSATDDGFDLIEEFK